MFTSTLVSQMLNVLLQHSIAHLVTEKGVSATEVAEAAGLPPRAPHRLLRASTGLGLFSEVGPGRFAPGPLGEALRLYEPMPWGFEVLDDLPEAIATERSSFELRHGVKMFTWLEQHPDEAAAFDRMIALVNAGEPEAVAEAYDFGAVRTVVDVGGGNGTLLAALLARHPGVHGVLFDQPSVIGRGAPPLEAHASRCETVGGDFFRAVPSDGDAYVLSHVLHDWAEDECVRILRSCADAMAPDGRVLIVEMVIPPGDAPHPGKMLDMLMAAFNGEGMERTEEEYRALLDAAGFRLERVIPTASPVSVVEAHPR
jgi:hypothetical protein